MAETAMTFRPSFAVSRRRAMSGPSRCGAVIDAPSSPDTHPGSPHACARSTIATTAPPSAERTRVAANTYRPSSHRLPPSSGLAVMVAAVLLVKAELVDDFDNACPLRLGQALNWQRQ